MILFFRRPSNCYAIYLCGRIIHRGSRQIDADAMKRAIGSDFPLDSTFKPPPPISPPALTRALAANSFTQNGTFCGKELAARCSLIADTFSFDLDGTSREKVMVEVMREQRSQQ